MLQNHDPVPESLRPLLVQKARHEYGHMVSARALGFQTGEVTLRLTSLEGHHEATSEIMIHQPLHDIAQISDYLERRVIVLFSGAMAEAQSAEDVGGDYVEEICCVGGDGARDMVKIHELIGLHLNITKPNQMAVKDVVVGRRELYSRLRTKSAKLVSAEYALIETLAVRHAEQIKTLNSGWGYHAQDFEAMPEFRLRFATA